MKLLLLILAAVASPFAIASKMEGFAANYYQDDLSIPSYDISKNLEPEIIVGNDIFVMEYSSLTDIAKKTGVSINQDDQASWFCLTAKNVNYWFISDNEMGKGYLTSIAISGGERQQACSLYNDSLRVRIQGVPLLNTTLKYLSTIFPNIPKNTRFQYCAETKSFGDFIQMNCLQYFPENKKVKGVLISQITSN